VSTIQSIFFDLDSFEKPAIDVRIDKQFELQRYYLTINIILQTERLHFNSQSLGFFALFLVNLAIF
jgi:hypothetical protein